MKGLTHFLTGLAIASCFPLAVEATIRETSLILFLGGMFGIMADTLDFRIAKFLEPHDYDIDPSPDDINPTEIARAMALAIDEAWYKQKTVQIQFHTIKMSADLWQRYSLTIDTDNKKIKCEIGPLVTTGKSPLPETEPPEDQRYGEWPYAANVLHTYDRANHVDIFSGPDFAFVPEGDHIRVDFIPFHRKWTHSITFPFLLMPLGFVFYGINEMGYIASLIILFAYWGHVLVDQTGMMGSNLFPPFTKKRSKGLGLCRSSDAIPNFFTNYSMVALTIWNVNYHNPEGITFGSTWATALGVTDYWPFYIVGLLNFFAYYVFIPLLCIYIITKTWHKFFVSSEEDELVGEEARQVEMMKSMEAIGSTED